MITPYDDRHITFCRNRILFEVYDDVIKTRLYDFYKFHNIKCYLPEYLEANGNRLVYIIDINGEYWEVVYSNKEVVFTHLNGPDEL